MTHIYVQIYLCWLFCKLVGDLYNQHQAGLSSYYARCIYSRRDTLSIIFAKDYLVVFSVLLIVVVGCLAQWHSSRASVCHPGGL